MDDTERFEMIGYLLDELEELSFDSIILIEGKKDRRSLEALIGDDFQSIEVQKDCGPVRAAEKVAETGLSAVILTDWDRKGDILAHELSIQLNALEVKYDMSIRKRLSDVCRKDIKDVESLSSLYSRLSQSNNL